MEVQIRMPSPPASDFNFHIGDWRCCVSAPTSPSRASELYREFNQTDDDFAFHVSKEAAKCTVSAAELFDNGRIRALNPPPNRPYGSRDGGEGGIELTRSRKSPLLKEVLNRSKERKTFGCGFTLNWNKQANNPYAPLPLLDDDDNHRGRGRGRDSTTSGPRDRKTRSLSPMRFPPWEENDDQNKNKKVVQTQTSSSTSNRIKRLKNFLLFRSASEGRASDKDPMKKFATFYKRQNEADKASKIRGPVSAHERHYAISKAASEDLKKKTFLPYKRGILLGR